MIKAIRIHQFKKLDQHAFEFGPGLSAVIGDNGQGKSTLLKAIMFGLGLFNGLGEKSRIPTRNSDGSVKVELDILIPRHGDVRIVRTLSAAKILTPEGTVLANGITPCLKFVEEAYGMKAADLSMLLYARQGGAQSLLAMGATELQRTVERLAKAHVLDAVMGLMNRDILQWQGELAGIGQIKDIATLQESVATLSGDITRRQECIEQATADWTELREREQVWLDALAQATEHARSRDATLQELNSTSAQLEKWKADLLNIHLEQYPDSLDAKLAEATQQCRAVNDAAAQLNGAMKLLISLDSDLRQAEWKLKSSQEQKALADALAPKLEEAERQLTAYQAEYKVCCDAATAATQDLREARASVEAGVCRECKRPFSEVEQAAAEQRAEAAFAVYEKAAAEKDNMTPRLRHLQTEYAQLSKETPKVWPGAVEEAEQLVLAIKRRITAAAESVGGVSLDAIRESYQARLTELSTWQQRQAHLTELTAKYHHDLSKHDVISKTIEELWNKELLLTDKMRYLNGKDILPEVHVVREELEKRQTAVRQIETVLNNLKTEVAVASSQLKQAESDLLSAQEALARAARIQEQKDTVAKLHQWLRKSRADLMQDLWDNLLGYASALMDRTTEGRISRVFYQGDELRVIENREEAPVSDLSGFQQSLLGLALRISMSRVFFGQDHPLLLDEPTSDAKENNAAKVAGMLQGLGTQVIFVTHREGDAVNANTVIQL